LEGAIRNPTPGFAANIQGQRISVGFNLLGQGWELLRFLDASSPAEYLRSRLEGICREVANEVGAALPDEPIVQALPSDVNPKTAVVEGALRLDQQPAQAPAAFLALDADTRNTFIGMVLCIDGSGGILDPSTRISQLGPQQRPNFAGDIGYGRLLEELWLQIPERYRKRVKDHLLGSWAYRSHYVCDSVEKHVILRGQNSFNNAWRFNRHPQTSLLADFLTDVWKPIWAETALL
jgi:hypothetical protein